MCCGEVADRGEDASVAAATMDEDQRPLLGGRLPVIDVDDVTPDLPPGLDGFVFDVEAELAFQQSLVAKPRG